jgi:hypothetical protein
VQGKPTPACHGRLMVEANWDQQTTRQFVQDKWGAAPTYLRVCADLPSMCRRVARPHPVHAR